MVDRCADYGVCAGSDDHPACGFDRSQAGHSDSGICPRTGGFIVPRSSIKNEKLYQDLRKKGDSKEKAARISNAAAGQGKSSVGRKGGKSGSYQDWTVPEWRKRAKELGMSGYSSLTKEKLVAKLRNH